ncbi:MAG: ATP-binding protein, partial [Anaerolineae bacterium]|nr:ATP-binding protein [Anaerolineae bacterium]
TESATPWAREKLFQLINYRYVARLPTIVTSATELKDMDPKIGIRFADTSRCTIQDIRAKPFLGGAGRSNGRSKRSRGQK